MTKRKKLDFDSQELTDNLKQSAGKGVDALFSPDPSTTPQEKPQEDQSTEKPTPHTDERTSVRPNVRTDDEAVRSLDLLGRLPPVPDKRRPERYAFQFWSDQITRIKKLNQILNLTQNPEDREEISLSDMVREALDDYLEEQEKQLAEQANGRTDG